MHIVILRLFGGNKLSRIIQNISNQVQEIQDIGYFLAPGEEVNVLGLPYGRDLGYLLNTQDLFTGIDNGIFILKTTYSIIRNGEDARAALCLATRTSDDNASFQNMTRSNPSQAQQTSVANTLNILFQQHAEYVLLEKKLQNTFVCFGNEYNKPKQYENVTSVNGCWQLDITTPGVIIDNCDTDSGLFASGLTSCGNFQMSMNPSLTETQKKWQINYLSGGFGQYFVLNAIPKKRNWSSYGCIKASLYGKAGISLQFFINNSPVPGSRVILKDGLQTVAFDVTKLNRRVVNSFGFGVCTMPEEVASFSIFINNIVALPMNVNYFYSGNIMFSLVPTRHDIAEIFLYPNDNIPMHTKLIYKITVDNGVSWHTLEDAQFNSWQSINQWHQGTNRRALAIKIEFISDDLVATPLLDDFFVMYKLIQE